MNNDFKTLPTLAISASQVRDGIVPLTTTDLNDPTPYLSVPFLPFVRFNVYDTADGGKEVRCEQHRTLEDYIGEDRCTSKSDLIRIVGGVFSCSYNPQVRFPSRTRLNNLFLGIPFKKAKESLRKLCHSYVYGYAKKYLAGLADKHGYLLISNNTNL